MTFRAVSIDDVREHGAPAAIVLATLREQGSSTTVKILVQYAAIGRLSGLDQRTVRRAMDRLRKAGVLKVEPFRASGHMLVRVMHDVEGMTRPDASGCICLCAGLESALKRPSRPKGGDRPLPPCTFP